MSDDRYNDYTSCEPPEYEEEKESGMGASITKGAVGLTMAALVGAGSSKLYDNYSQSDIDLGGSEVVEQSELKDERAAGDCPKQKVRVVEKVVEKPVYIQAQAPVPTQRQNRDTYAPGTIEFYGVVRTRSYGVVGCYYRGNEFISTGNQDGYVIDCQGQRIAGYKPRITTKVILSPKKKGYRTGDSNFLEEIRDALRNGRRL